MMSEISGVKRDKCLIVQIHFNTYSFNKARHSAAWIQYRMGIFMKYTCKSLKGQTSCDFTALVLYADETESLIQDALQQYDALPSHIRFVPLSRRRETILQLVEGYKQLYHIRLDSDDMYVKDYIERLHAYNPKSRTQALISSKGYWYDSSGHRMKGVAFPSPPFYTLIYKEEQLADWKEYKLRGHYSVMRLRHEYMAGRNYVAVMHGKNSSSSYGMSQRTGVKIESDQIDTLLSQFM
jgi:Protein of unknown function (DUF3118).